MPITLPSINRDLTADSAERARQHWVPEAYLRQWCDPNTPQGAYLWVCPADRSKQPRRRSPKRTFTSTDMNTMNKGGVRNLRLESIYHSMETSFGNVRAKVVNGEQVNDSDLDAVVNFIAAQIVRTPKFRSYWSALVDMDQETRSATISDTRLRQTFEDALAALWANRFQALCLVAFPRVLELVQQMRVRLYKAAARRTFITSDAPCCVIDYRDTAWSVLDCLGSPTVNVLMPLSPDVVAILDRSSQAHSMSKISPGHSAVNRINMMIWRGAFNEVVLPDATVRADWFSEDHPEQWRRYVAL